MFSKKKLLLLALIPLLSACSSESNDTETSNDKDISVVESDIANEVDKPKVDYSDVVYEITKDGYPKTYNTWGKEWIDKINNMMPLAVEAVAANPKCDAPEMIGLSENRSTPKEEAVFFVDCANYERFFVSQNELKEGTELQAESEVLAGDPSKYIEPCKDLIKAQLTYPSSFKAVFGGTNAFKGTSGNVVVEMDFTAKNGLGNEIPQSAKCLFTTSGTSEITLQDR